MVLCVECHDELHAGTLSEKKKKLRKIRRAGYVETHKSGSEGLRHEAAYIAVGPGNRTQPDVLPSVLYRDMQQE